MKTETMQTKDGKEVVRSIYFDKNEEKNAWLCTSEYVLVASIFEGEKNQVEREKYKKQEVLFKKRMKEIQDKNILEILGTYLNLSKIGQGKMEQKGNQIELYSETIPNPAKRLSFYFVNGEEPDEKTAEDFYNKLLTVRSQAFEKGRKIAEKQSGLYDDLLEYARIPEGRFPG